MSPFTQGQTELALCVGRVRQRYHALQQRQVPAAHGDWEDHRTEAMAELTEAIDRIEPGLGSSLFLSLYPHANVIGRGVAA